MPVCSIAVTTSTNSPRTSALRRSSGCCCTANCRPRRSCACLAGNWQSDIFDTVLVLYADHEFNASTFSARVTASTLADIYASLTTALGTLKGPLHGGANEASLKMVEEISSPDRAETWVMERLKRKERIMGFGHRVYKKGDSRVPMMRALVRSVGRRLGQEFWAPICERLEAVMEREKQLCANLDLYAGPLLHMLGIPPELNTPVFACA